MLRITDYFQTNDLEADRMISSFISARLLKLLEEIQKNTISDYFPEKYPESKREPVIRDLYNLLKSENMYNPALIMEYIIFHLIEDKIEYCNDNKMSTIERLPASDREYILQVYRNNPQTVQEAEGLVTDIEDLISYPDSCFLDFDFKFLDYMSETELFHSKLNKMLDFGTKEYIIYSPGKIIFS